MTTFEYETYDANAQLGLVKRTIAQLEAQHYATSLQRDLNVAGGTTDTASDDERIVRLEASILEARSKRDALAAVGATAPAVVARADAGGGAPRYFAHKVRDD